METIEYKTVDKSNWERGEWDNEPDKKQWLDEATGLPCLIVRAPVTGSLCGYVGIAPEHPLFAIGYDKSKPRLNKFWRKIKNKSVGKRGIFTLLMANDRKPTPDMLLDAHGGITFSDFCHPAKDESHGICHVAPGQDKIWWFGFDCSHAGDVSPAMDACIKGLGIPEMPSLSLEGYDTYRNMDYVTAEVASLAKQLKALAA